MFQTQLKIVSMIGSTTILTVIFNGCKCYWNVLVIGSQVYKMVYMIYIECGVQVFEYGFIRPEYFKKKTDQSILRLFILAKYN